jgi:hypothetical protein
MTYCREMRDKKTAVRERVKAVVLLSFLSRYSMRVSLLFSPLAPLLADSTAVSLEWWSDNLFNPTFETLSLH